ncbi:MAG: TIGR03982 family His-Xaa-Ser system protein [Allorhizobium sp.]
MRLRSLRTSLFVTLGFVIGVGVGIVSQPIWKLVVIDFNQDQFSKMTFKCDHAMREHLIAKQAVVNGPSAETVRAVEAAEIGLIDCQDYDLMRKALGRWGLTENEISEMSLRAVEERAASLQDVIKVHEIRY